MEDKLVLGGVAFRTKTSAMERVRAVLHDTPRGIPLTGEDDALIRDLLELHPEAPEKIGCGVRHIEVRTNRVNGASHPGFWVVRQDGTSIDFSYKNCLSGKKPNGKDQFARACRQAIQMHVNEERRRFFAEAVVPTCALTGTPISLGSVHVDHCPPCTFARIVDAFISLYGVDLEDPNLLDPDSLIVPTLADPVLRDRFVQFHNNHAKLRVISIDANLELVKP